MSAGQAVADVLARVPSPCVGALWDTPPPLPHGRDGRARPTSCSAGRILHTHVKDARRDRASGWQLLPLGEGEVPVRDMLATLRGARLERLGQRRVGEEVAPRARRPRGRLPAARECCAVLARSEPSPLAAARCRCGAAPEALLAVAGRGAGRPDARDRPRPRRAAARRGDTVPSRRPTPRSPTTASTSPSTTSSAGSARCGRGAASGGCRGAELQS